WRDRMEPPRGRNSRAGVGRWLRLRRVPVRPALDGRPALRQLGARRRLGNPRHRRLVPAQLPAQRVQPGAWPVPAHVARRSRRSPRRVPVPVPFRDRRPWRPSFLIEVGMKLLSIVTLAALAAAAPARATLNVIAST